ncbi:hypothetical protein EMCRGX_G018536 [Ephydatia muelleri]
MNCVTEPIFDIPIDQVCLPGLHITQGIFVTLLDLLEDACHQLDLQLAYTYQEESSSSSTFTKYAEELHKLQVAKAGRSPGGNGNIGGGNYICCSSIWRGEPYHRAPYPAHKAVCGQDGLDSALQSFRVHRQQYFGGTFVGNHIQKALKPSNMECLCSSMVEVAKAKCPALVASATQEHTRFRRSLSLLGQYHQIYDQNFINEIQCNELDK